MHPQDAGDRPAVAPGHSGDVRHPLLSAQGLGQVQRETPARLPAAPRLRLPQGIPLQVSQDD